MAIHRHGGEEIGIVTGDEIGFEKNMGFYSRGGGIGGRVYRLFTPYNQIVDFPIGAAAKELEPLAGRESDELHHALADIPYRLFN